MNIRKFMVRLGGVEHEIEVEEINTEHKTTYVQQSSAEKSDKIIETKNIDKPKVGVPKNVDGEEVCAPLQGKLLSINKAEGDEVVEGDLLFIIEAMKMENEVVAPCSGKIKKIYVTKDDTLSAGDLMAVIC